MNPAPMNAGDGWEEKTRGTPAGSGRRLGVKSLRSVRRGEGRRKGAEASLNLAVGG